MSSISPRHHGGGIPVAWADKRAMCSEWFQNVLDGNGAPKVFDVFVFFPYECSTPGPHLRRRMMVEAGLVEGGSRTSRHLLWWWQCGRRV